MSATTIGPNDLIPVGFEDDPAFVFAIGLVQRAIRGEGPGEVPDETWVWAARMRDGQIHTELSDYGWGVHMDVTGESDRVAALVLVNRAEPERVIPIKIPEGHRAVFRRRRYVSPEQRGMLATVTIVGARPIGQFEGGAYFFVDGDHTMTFSHNFNEY